MAVPGDDIGAVVVRVAGVTRDLNLDNGAVLIVRNCIFATVGGLGASSPGDVSAARSRLVGKSRLMRLYIRPGIVQSHGSVDVKRKSQTASMIGGRSYVRGIGLED